MKTRFRVDPGRLNICGIVLQADTRIGPPIRASGIIVYGLEDARTALGVAAGLGVAAILVSAPGAAGYAGCGWFAALIASARAEFPKVALTAILDCADQPGDVLAALREGIRDIHFTGRDDVAARLADIAGQHGAVLHRLLPEALDLRHCRDPAARCRNWLSRQETRA
ncbi:MAG: hypothetical protein GC191_03565 [Azospirillum sp.]|nr:hypothetical protein [Azospirillum sp.]